MSNIGGSAHNPTKKSSGIEGLREKMSDLSSSAGNMATRQYQRAQDMATDALDDTSHAIQRNPLTAMGIGLGVGFLFGFLLGILTGSRT
jgi:ElaB/YqjD/DUF883 family membrane-anchored ribosome-binding protein